METNRSHRGGDDLERGLQNQMNMAPPAAAMIASAHEIKNKILYKARELEAHGKHSGEYSSNQTQTTTARAATTNDGHKVAINNCRFIHCPPLFFLLSALSCCMNCLMQHDKAFARGHGPAMGFVPAGSARRRPVPAPLPCPSAVPRKASVRCDQSECWLPQRPAIRHKARCRW